MPSATVTGYFVNRRTIGPFTLFCLLYCICFSNSWYFFQNQWNSSNSSFFSKSMNFFHNPRIYFKKPKLFQFRYPLALIFSQICQLFFKIDDIFISPTFSDTWTFFLIFMNFYQIHEHVLSSRFSEHFSCSWTFLNSWTPFKF